MSLNLPVPRDCTEPGCARKASNLLQRECRVHEIVSIAEWCTPEEMAEVRALLTAREPLSLEEREQRRRDGALRALRSDFRGVNRDEKRAREHGATDEQIEQARALGIHDAETTGY